LKIFVLGAPIAFAPKPRFRPKIDGDIYITDFDVVKHGGVIKLTVRDILFAFPLWR
jgi:hypothetical protein